MSESRPAGSKGLEPNCLVRVHAALETFWLKDDDLTVAAAAADKLFSETIAKADVAHASGIQSANGFRLVTEKAVLAADQWLEQAGLETRSLSDATPRGYARIASNISPDAMPSLRASSRRAEEASAALGRAVMAMQERRRAMDKPRVIAAGIAANLLIWITWHFLGFRAAVLLLPLMAGASVHFLRPQAAIALTDRAVDWVARQRERSANSAVRAILWLPGYVGPWTQRIVDPFVRTAARVAGYGYLFSISLIVFAGVVFGALAALLYILAIVAAVVFVIFIAAEALKSDK